MAHFVECPSRVEAEVRLIEDTSPSSIVAAAVDALGRGVAPDRLLAAAAVAVSQSTELPPDHHGGPVHPVCGLHSVLALSGRLGGREAWVPVVQSVALANKHVHSAAMGPTAMPALAPLACGDGEKFLDALWSRQPLAAERYLLGAL